MEIPKQSIRGIPIHLRAITGPASGRHGLRGGREGEEGIVN